MADPRLVRRCLERVEACLLKAAPGDAVQETVGLDGRLNFEARLGRDYIREEFKILWPPAPKTLPRDFRFVVCHSLEYNAERLCKHRRPFPHHVLCAAPEPCSFGREL